MAAAKIAVCQGSSCSSCGSQALLRDIEELAFGACKVEETQCVGRCGRGPNVVVELSANKQKVIEGVNSFKNAVAVIEDEAKGSLSSMAKKVGKIKYEVRREQDPMKIESTLQKAFSLLGDAGQAAVSEPVLLSQLLALRANYELRPNPNKAVEDAEQAVQLQPKWAQARLVLGNAYEACGRFAEAVDVLKEAIEIGGCIKEGAVNRQLQRLKRKVDEQPSAMARTAADKNPLRTNEEAAAAAASKEKPPPAEAPEKAQAKAKPKPKGKPKARPKRAPSIGPGAEVPGAKEKAQPISPGGEVPGAKEKDAAAAAGPPKGDSASAPKGTRRGSSAPKPPEAGQRSGTASAKARSAPPPPTEQEWRLDSVRRLNHDSIHVALSARRRLAPVPPDIGDLWHVDVLRELEFGEELRRAYTPLSSLEDYKKGILKLMIKVYATGAMTSYLASLRPGGHILVSHPLSTTVLEGHDGLVMVAGGSSLTVALQACKSLLARHPMGVPVHLVLCNRTVDDVLYQDVLEELLQEHPGFSLAHCISNGPVPASTEGKVAWKRGRIELEDLYDRTTSDMRGVVSGPPGLCAAVLHIWAQLGRDRDRLAVLDPLPPEAEASHQPRIISL